MMQKLVILCLLAASMTSCAWLKEDTDDCPYGFWLQLSYTYNILDVEAAQEYVKDAYVYVYDTEGHYVTRIYAPYQSLLMNNHRIRVEGLAEGDYQFVVWSGSGNNAYAVSGDTGEKSDFRITLATATATSKEDLPPLFYGHLRPVHFSDSYAVHTVSLMKNTNQLACLVVPMDDGVTMDKNDYVLRIVTDNAVMDANNAIQPTTPVTYEPYLQDAVTVDDADYGQLHGLRFGLTTLRLMADRDCRIILEKKSTGETVFDISLPEYIGMIGELYTQLGRPLTVQEYLDRQDFYTIVFYLSGELDRLMQLRVNTWRIRANNHLKL
jgi:hypothetical protein